MEKTNEPFTLVDFLSIISEIVFLPNGKQSTPFEVDFSRHMNVLYTLENEFLNSFSKRINILKILQQKTSKQLDVIIDNSFNASEKNYLIYFCEENGIGFTETKRELKLFINKYTKGVIEERKW